VGKGELTRQTILERARVLASEVGLEGLTIGQLADALDMSKSGLFAHFASKEGLQLAVLENAAAVFVDAVVRPALKAPRGEKRVRALFERWLGWPAKAGTRGCLFVSAATELDDRPGPARELLVRQQRDWLDTIAHVVRTAVAEGNFRGELDVEQFAHELYGIMFMYQHAARLLADPKAEKRARTAFDRLVRSARAAE
jgi:AcrR family transcriptional regulator